jgi:hypothetical protein
MDGEQFDPNQFQLGELGALCGEISFCRYNPTWLTMLRADS